MKKIRVELKERSYDILIGSGIMRLAGAFARKLKLGDQAFIITNPGIKKLFGKALERSFAANSIDTRFKVVADTEKSKSLGQAYSIIKEIASVDASKKIFIVALGGGVIGDLAGFVASVYKRGIPYIQVPTTLLAQVDSSIGGKTAVDLALGKNLAGAFYQPRLVISDTNALKTLDKRQLKSGMAEVIKYGAIKDKKLFAYIEKRYPDILSLKPLALEYIILRCATIKADVVRKDERETKGLRVILNFGHTLGHAIEAASGYKGLNHGECVGLGMILAGQISKKLKLASDITAARIRDLISDIGLPTAIKGAPLNKIIQAHYHDKKFKGNKNRFVLIREIGKTSIREGVPLQVIKEALEAISS